MRQRGLALAAGLALIFALDVLITMGDIWSAEARSFGIDTRAGANRALSPSAFKTRGCCEFTPGALALNIAEKLHV